MVHPWVPRVVFQLLDQTMKQLVGSMEAQWRPNLFYPLNVETSWRVHGSPMGTTSCFSTFGSIIETIGGFNGSPIATQPL